MAIDLASEWRKMEEIPLWVKGLDIVFYTVIVAIIGLLIYDVFFGPPPHSPDKP